MKKIFAINFVIVIFIITSFELSVKYLLNITTQGISENLIDKNSSRPRFNNKNVSNSKVFGKKVFTDKEGFRSENESLKTKKYKNKNPKIYFVGGSVPFGMGVEQSNSFSGILKRNNKKFIFHNASVIGSNLDNNYFILKNKVKKDNLSFVFVNFSFDDITSDEIINFANNENTNKNKSFFKLVKNNFLIKKINALIRTKSYTYVLFKNYFFKAEERYYNDALEKYHNINNLNYMKNYLDKISKLNKEIDNKLIFLIIPYNNQLTEKNCSKNDIGELMIEKEIKERNFKYIKFKDEFCKEKNRKRFYIKFDPSHLSKEGHRFIAKVIQKKYL